MCFSLQWVNNVNGQKFVAVLILRITLRAKLKSPQTSHVLRYWAHTWTLKKCFTISVTICSPVADYIKHVDEKITPLLIEKKVLNNEQMEKLGKRDQDTYPCCHSYIHVHVLKSHVCVCVLFCQFLWLSVIFVWLANYRLYSVLYLEVYFACTSVIVWVLKTASPLCALRDELYIYFNSVFSLSLRSLLMQILKN